MVLSRRSDGGIRGFKWRGRVQPVATGCNRTQRGATKSAIVQNEANQPAFSRAARDRIGGCAHRAAECGEEFLQRRATRFNRTQRGATGSDGWQNEAKRVADPQWFIGRSIIVPTTRR